MGLNVDEAVGAAFRVQEEERLDGFGSANPYLEQLRALPEEQVLNVVRDLRRGTRPERELSARVLGQSSVGPLVVVNEVRQALSAEDDPDVVGWLVSALVYPYSADALPILIELSESRYSAVRSVVPDGLSSCAENLDDIIRTLARLMTDPSRDVRWSATFEARAWIAEQGSSDAGRRLTTVMSWLAAAEPDAEIREMAQACPRPRAEQPHGRPQT